MPSPLLHVRNVSVCHRATGRYLFAHASFEIHKAEALGLLGPSGTGKSTLARALTGMLSSSTWQVSGSIRIGDAEVVDAPEREWRKLRGKVITIVRQEPELALNPVRTAGWQIEEVLKAHFPSSRETRREQVRQALRSVGLMDERYYSAEIQDLSGGERQRLVVAQALAAKPEILILDEPTSAVDTVTQAEILQLLRQLRDRFQLALLFITHNPALLRTFGARIMEIRDRGIRSV